jgi:hypothetical protein
MNVLPEEKNILDETQTGDLRSVRDIRKCGIVYGRMIERRYLSRRIDFIKIVSVSFSSTGFLLVVMSRYFGCKVIKLDTLYKVISTLSLKDCFRCVDSCYNSHHDFLVVGGDKKNENKLFFVDVKDKISLNRSVSIPHNCRSLTCHSDKLYLIDKDSVFIYSIDGEFIETLYKVENVSSQFLVIAVSNDGSMIYILNDRDNLITINSSGNHLYTLNFPEPGRFLSSSIGRRVCVDDQGNVVILPEKNSKSKLIKIIQVSPNGEKCYGVLFQFDSNIEYERIVFDSERCALVLVGKTKEIMVLTLR